MKKMFLVVTALTVVLSGCCGHDDEVDEPDARITIKRYTHTDMVANVAKFCIHAEDQNGTWIPGVFYQLQDHYGRTALTGLTDACRWPEADRYTVSAESITETGDFKPQPRSITLNKGDDAAIVFIYPFMANAN